MNQPMFFVKSVRQARAKNQAQQFVVDEVRGLEYRTIEDAACLERLGRFLVWAVKEARELHPRSKEMTVRRVKTIPHEHTFSIEVVGRSGYSFEPESVATISVVAIQGEWKGTNY